MPKSPSVYNIAQLCRAISSQLRHASTIGKYLLSINISPTCPYNMVNFGPLAAEIVSLVWGTPADFNGFRVLTAKPQRWTEGATCIRQDGHHVAHWPTFLFNKFFCDCRYVSFVRRYSPTKLCDSAEMAIFGDFLRPVFSASRVSS